MALGRYTHIQAEITVTHTEALFESTQGACIQGEIPGAAIHTGAHGQVHGREKLMQLHAGALGASFLNTKNNDLLPMNLPTSTFPLSLAWNRGLKQC